MLNKLTFYLEMHLFLAGSIDGKGMLVLDDYL